MRVAILTNTFSPSKNGVAVSLELLRQGLKKLGHSVLIFAPAYPGAEYKDPEGVFRFPAITYDDYPLALPIGLAKVRQILIDEKIEVIHLPHPWWVSRWGLKLAEELDLPTMATIHTQYGMLTGHIPLVSQLTSWYLKRKVINFCSAVDLVTTPGTGRQKQLQALGFKTPVIVVPNPTQLDNFSQVSGEKIRAKYNITDDAPIVGYVGRLSPEKSLDKLMEAFEILRQKLPDSRFLLIGDGKMRKRLEWQAAKIGNVIFAGSIDHNQVPEYLGACTVFMTASIFEVQPLTYIEALASGLPIVAFEAAGNEVVEDGKNGCLVSLSAGPAGLASTAHDMLTNPQQLAARSKTAKNSIAQYEQMAAVKETLAAYKQAIDLHHSHPRAF